MMEAASPNILHTVVPQTTYTSTAAVTIFIYYKLHFCCPAAIICTNIFYCYLHFCISNDSTAKSICICCSIVFIQTSTALNIVSSCCFAVFLTLSLSCSLCQLYISSCQHLCHLVVFLLLLFVLHHNPGRALASWRNVMILKE